MSMRDRLVPAIAGAAVLLVGLMVVMLLRSAANDGTEALEKAKVAQVGTTADSFNARVESSISSLGGLGARPWELTLRSAADQATLKTFAVDPDALSGTFLIDADDTVTSGVLLRDGMLGSTFDPPGWEKAKAELASSPAVVLPVASSGVTTELPSYAFAVAIRGASPTSVRGAFVFEQALTNDSPFNQEIRGLVGDRNSSATWRFLDDNGAVVATTLTTGLGKPVADERLRNLTEGLHQVGDDLVVSADVPVVGWHVVFTQNRSEFVEPLAGPLQSAGLILVLLLLAVGLTLTVVLARRLRQSREQEKRLLALNRSQDEFISVVSHELRTPVSGVLGFLQTSLDHWNVMSDEDRHSAVRRAFTNARRLQAMTRDVLDTESIESGRFGYVRHPMDLADEVRTAVDAFSSGLADDVTVTLPDTPVMMDGDPDRIQQVLANLLDNARKNAPSETRIEVSLEQTDDVARLVVEDHGPGIDPDQIERIFDKFVRGRAGAVTGTGLGLYISRRIVDAHEGRIWAESRPGESTQFIVELPCQSLVTH
ncbi:MAG: HAMP domain-containing sensor histidine kinase [Marmoricola sp.]